MENPFQYAHTSVLIWDKLVFAQQKLLLSDKGVSELLLVVKFFLFVVSLSVQTSKTIEIIVVREMTYEK